MVLYWKKCTNGLCKYTIGVKHTIGITQYLLLHIIAITKTSNLKGLEYVKAQKFQKSRKSRKAKMQKFQGNEVYLKLESIYQIKYDMFNWTFWWFNNY